MLATRSLLLISAALFVTAACTQGEAVGASVPPLPTTVSCAEAPRLKQDAANARRGTGAVTGDRAQIINGNRAKFLASLAAIAQLKCKANAAEVDALLGKALEVGHVAGTTNSQYEAAQRWTEADLIATDAIALLISQLPASTSR
jgi:hypothetical protein